MIQSPLSTCPQSQAPLTAAERELYITRPPAWESGMEAPARLPAPGNDSGVVALLLAVVVLVGLNMRYVRRIFKTLPQDLVSVRRRANAFDDHTANETRVTVLLLFQLFVLEGILLFVWLLPELNIAAMPSKGMSIAVALLSCLCGGFYLFQLIACRTVGYVFTDKVNSGLWRRGLNSSQALLSLALLAPALIAIFYPALAQWMLMAGAALYVLSRICYIIKGFRIFYTNPGSLLYFILYLCTLEIIPVIFSCFLAREICGKII